MPNALIFIAAGTEEMEFTITYDVLVRGGFKCTSALVKEPTSVREDFPSSVCSRGIRIIADEDLVDIDTEALYDVIVVPGGAKGAEIIGNDVKVQTMLEHHHEKGKLVGLICAGSVAAKKAGLAKGGKITSHPSVKGELEGEYQYQEDSVVIEGNLITSRGPGTAFPFALKLVEIVQGRSKVEEIYGPMMFPS